MEVHLRPELEAKINELASASGRRTDELVQDALLGYLDELAEVRTLLDNRYDAFKSGRVQPVDGEAFFESLRLQEEELLNRQLKDDNQ